MRLGQYDIGTALQRGLVVHQSACNRNVFWDDAKTKRQKKNAGKLDFFDEDDCGAHGVGGSDDASMGGGFTGIADQDLFPVALESYKNAQRRAYLKKEKKRDTSEDETLSFLSMNDHVVMNKLQNVGWEPRNGYVNLLPLCVFTNGF